jgi:hypothetical protein
MRDPDPVANWQEVVAMSDEFSRTRAYRQPYSPLHPYANIRPRQVPSLEALEPSQLPFTLSDSEALLQSSHIGLDVVAFLATSQEQQGQPSLVRATFLHEPPGRLGQSGCHDTGYEGGEHLEANRQNPDDLGLFAEDPIDHAVCDETSNSYKRTEQMLTSMIDIDDRTTTHRRLTLNPDVRVDHGTPDRPRRTFSKVQRYGHRGDPDGQTDDQFPRDELPKPSTSDPRSHLDDGAYPRTDGRDVERPLSPDRIGDVTGCHASYSDTSGSHGGTHGDLRRSEFPDGLPRLDSVCPEDLDEIGVAEYTSPPGVVVPESELQ